MKATTTHVTGVSLGTIQTTWGGLATLFTALVTTLYFY